MDIPGAFLHADMDNVYMLLEGTNSKLIVKLEPSLYRKIFGTNKKVMYGTLLFWTLLSITILETIIHYITGGNF